MTKGLEQMIESLRALAKDEFRVLIRKLPRQKLVRHIQQNPKVFSKPTSGILLKSRSKLLVQKLPEIYVRVYGTHLSTTMLIASLTKDFIQDVGRLLKENNIREKDLHEALTPPVILTLLEILNPDLLPIYFKLTGNVLSPNQIKLLGDVMPYLLEAQQIRHMIEKQHETSLQELSVRQEQEHGQEISILNNRIAEIEQELEAAKQKNSSMEQHLSALNNTNQLHLTELKQNLKVQAIEFEKQSTVIEQQAAAIRMKEEQLQEQQKINQSLWDELSLKHSEFAKLAQAKWQLEHTAVVAETDTLKQQCRKLEDRKEQLHHEVARLQDKTRDWDQVINHYFQNIDARVLEHRLDSILLGNVQSAATIQTTSPVSYSTSIYMRMEDDPGEREICLDRQDFILNLSDNFQAIGIGGSADELANYVVGILCAGLVPLIVGYRSREAAFAFSAAFCGGSPCLLILPSGYSSTTELEQLYVEADSTVVLIEEAIGTLHEQTLLALLKRRAEFADPDKLLLLTTENLDAIKYMPDHLLQYMALVVVEPYDVFRKDPFVYSDARTVLFNRTPINTSSHYPQARLLYKDLGLGRIFIRQRAGIAAYTSEVPGSERAFHQLYKFELSLLARLRDFRQQLQRNVTEQSAAFTDELIRLIQKDYHEE